MCNRINVSGYLAWLYLVYAFLTVGTLWPSFIFLNGKFASPSESFVVAVLLAVFILVFVHCGRRLFGGAAKKGGIGVSSSSDGRS